MNEYLDPDHKQAQAEEARRKAQEFDRQLREAFVTLTSTTEGLLFMRWLIDQSGILKSQYRDSHADAAYYEGRRSIGAKILNIAAQAEKLPAIMEMEGNSNG